MNYLGANSLAVYPSTVSGSQVIFGWDYAAAVWSRVRIIFWASGHSQLQLGYFKVDSIQTQSSCNCAQAYSSIITPFAQNDNPVIRVFINGFDVSSNSLQISVSPSNLQGTKLTVTVTVGAATMLKRLWLSWLAFSPGTASFGSYGGQYSQNKYSGSNNKDISNSLYQTPYIFHGINLLSLSNTQPLAFTSSVDSNFILTVSASRVIDDFSIIYIAIGVQPGKHCASCGSGLVACGNNCLSSCAPGSYAFTYNDGGVGCRTCSSKLGQILSNGKCVQGSVSTSTATTTVNLYGNQPQSPPNNPVPPVITIPSSILYGNTSSFPPTSPPIAISAPPAAPSCPPNAFFNGDECVCDVGFVWMTGKCQAPVIQTSIPTIILNPNKPPTPAASSAATPLIPSQPQPQPQAQPISQPASPSPSPQPSSSTNLPQPQSPTYQANSANCGPNSYNNGLGICVCNQGCYFLNNACVAGTPCSANSHRAADGSCVCDSGFTNYNGTCSKCPQGAFWSSSSSQCIYVCGQNSAYSASAGACVCNSGFGQLNGACQACPQGYFISKGYCVTCPVNSAYNSASGNCDCISGFFTNQWGICAQKCGTNEVYNSATQICSCVQGLGRVNGACQICPPGSTPTPDGSACSTCGTNEVLVSGNCVCQQGYAYNSAGVCLACASLPNGFLVNGICAVCPGTMVYNGNTCACPLGKISQGSLCISQCQSDEVLDSKGNCFTCQNNQIISQGSCTCAPGYTLQGNGICGLSCPVNQFIFQNSACAACPLNTVYNAAVMGCTCPNNYYMDNYGTCQKLTLQAIACPSGQYFDSTSGCLPCSSSCKTCKSATQCLTCAQTGYSVNNQGVCNPACGDGLIVGSETCDTGSTYSPGCVSCQIQAGYTCSGQPSVCKSTAAPAPATPSAPPTPPPAPAPSSALSQVGSTSINSNNVFISLQTNPTFTFNNPT